MVSVMYGQYVKWREREGGREAGTTCLNPPHRVAVWIRLIIAKRRLSQCFTQRGHDLKQINHDLETMSTLQHQRVPPHFLSPYLSDQ